MIRAWLAERVLDYLALRSTNGASIGWLNSHPSFLTALWFGLFTALCSTADLRTAPSGLLLVTATMK